MSESSASTAPIEIRVGPHLFRWEPPDIGYVSYTGDLNGELATAMSFESRKITVGKRRVFLLVNMARVGQISKEARSSSAAGSKDLAIRGIAVVGAAGHVRIVVGLVSRAVELMQPNQDSPTRFFATEAEGRQWIAQRRRALDGT